MGLQYYEDSQKRIPYAEIVEHERFLKGVLKEADPMGELTIAGSYRRQKPDSGDIDLLVKGKTRKTYETFIKLLTDKGYLVCHLAKGQKKYMGLGNLGRSDDPTYGKNRRIDIMYTKPQEYPFAILYFTGSSEFNQRMRKDILDRGLTINEYSLKDNETKQPAEHTFVTERDIFDYLGYDYVEPEDRI
jgi:DNA polymerase/3'-5' exonuclease PolX